MKKSELVEMLQANDNPLPYVFDLFYDIKTYTQLKNEVQYLTERLAHIIDLCRRNNMPIDEYVKSTLDLK
jgi:hypothetical protein